jgi:predicted permease
MRALWSRVRALVSGRRLDHQLDEEVRAHLDALTDDYVRRGMTTEQARLAARRDFGGVTQMQDAYRERRGIPALETFAQDLRYALRALGRYRGFTAVAVLSLALGIGATTAVFSVMNAVVLRPLAAMDAGRLVVLSAFRNNQRFVLFNPEFEEIRVRQRSLSGMFAVSERPFLRVELPGAPASYVAASLVSGTYFEVLGITPAAGRLLGSGDDDVSGTDAPPCPAVISDGLWNQRFSRRAEALGSRLRLRDRDCVIVGVTPPGFRGHQAGSVPDVWMPLRPLTERRMLEHQTQAFFAGVMGRLNPGVTREQAQAELTAIYRQIQALEPPLPATFEAPPQPEELSLHVSDGAAGLGGLRRQFGQPLTMALAAVVLVLLIAAINVANLLLARGAARLPELATRAALGASRGRLARQLITEGSAIAVAGGVLGIVFAVTATPLIASAMTFQSGTSALDVSLDGRVLLASVAATMIAAIVVGVIPGMRLSGLHSSPSRAIGQRTMHAAGSQRVMRTLLLVQFALSLLLVTAAGLLLRTSIGLSGIELGFDSGRVVQLEVADESPGSNSVNVAESEATREQRAAIYRIADERVNAIPGVESASLSWYGLFSSNDLWTPLIDPLRPADRREARVNFVSTRYFDTVGMRLVRGRTFTHADGYRAPKVAVVNETLARARFGSRDPIGAQLTPDYPSRDDEPLTIVGVIHDARYNNLREAETGPMMWMPLPQAPYRIGSVDLRVSSGAEAEVARQAASVLGSVNPYFMVRRTTSLADQVQRTAARERLLFNVSAVFGTFALALAAIGLYGTLTYKVARRQREIGVRLALGAQRESVVALFIREALALAAVATLVGVPLALAAGSWLRAFLFGVEPQDPVTLIGACVVLAITVLLASCVPAMRASRVDSVIALRSE